MTPILEEEFYDASAASDDERNELNCRGTINTDDFECQLICPGDVEGMIPILDIEFWILNTIFSSIYFFKFL